MPQYGARTRAARAEQQYGQFSELSAYAMVWALIQRLHHLRGNEWRNFEHHMGTRGAEMSLRRWLLYDSSVVLCDKLLRMAATWLTDEEKSEIDRAIIVKVELDDNRIAALSDARSNGAAE